MESVRGVRNAFDALGLGLGLGVVKIARGVSDAFDALGRASDAFGALGLSLVNTARCVSDTSDELGMFLVTNTLVVLVTRSMR